MNTPHRIAAVSLAFQRMLAQALPAEVELTALPLAVAEQFVPTSNRTAHVNLALIRATVPASLRETPARPSPSSSPILGIPLALELQYLVTIYADAAPAGEFSVERLLEAVLQQVHQHPVLTPADLQAGLPDADPSMSVSVHYEGLSDADLRDLFRCCQATWQPALVYRVRLTHLVS